MCVGLIGSSTIADPCTPSRQQASEGFCANKGSEAGHVGADVHDFSEEIRCAFLRGKKENVISARLTLPSVMAALNNGPHLQGTLKATNHDAI